MHLLLERKKCAKSRAINYWARRSNIQMAGKVLTCKTFEQRALLPWRPLLHGPSVVRSSQASLEGFWKLLLPRQQPHGSFVGFRWLIETAHFSHKLQCGRTNLFVRHRRIKVEQGFNVSAHKHYLHVSAPAKCCYPRYSSGNC